LPEKQSTITHHQDIHTFNVARVCLAYTTKTEILKQRYYFDMACILSYLTYMEKKHLRFNVSAFM